MNKTLDCVIIGAGVSGITAAIYLKRWGLNIKLLEKKMPGGIINNTSIIENYPGLLNITGPEFTNNLYKQIKELDINYQYADVKEIKIKKKEFTIISNQENMSAKSIIIATGRVPRRLGIKLEEELIGKGISTCATCDGPLYKNKEVCIVGGGNSALEESLYLSKLCKKVTIINRSESLKADEIFQKKIKEKKNIEIMYNTNIISFKTENDRLSKLEVKTKNEEKIISCDGLFLCIGSEPIYPNLKELKTENRYIVVNEKMQTNIDGICACGDIIKKDLYQIITAAAEGAIAASTIKKYLNDQK